MTATRWTFWIDPVTSECYADVREDGVLVRVLLGDLGVDEDGDMAWTTREIVWTRP